MRDVCLLAIMCGLCMPVGPAQAAWWEELATVVDRTTHRASSYDRTGGNDDFISGLEPGATRVLLDTAGPGRITHMWFTVARFPGHDTVLRDLVLRIYWEHADVPSVEVPLGDFFVLGHGQWYPYQSLPMAVGINPVAMNCYWPMPFYRHARVELYNNGRRTVRKIYYHIDYELGPVPPRQGLFHALYRRNPRLPGQKQEGNVHGRDNYVILETTGTGHYVGCALFVNTQAGSWWGEGDDMIFIDGAEEPTIVGTGSEDYFSNAWGYKQAFSYPFYGAPQVAVPAEAGGYTTVYRWHIADPIRFSKSIRVTIERVYPAATVNDYTSVAYWYQLEPIARREPLPVAEDNHPAPPARPRLEISATELEAVLARRGIKVRAVTAGLDEGLARGGWLEVDPQQGEVELPVQVPRDGHYRVELRFAAGRLPEGLLAGVEGDAPIPLRPAGQADPGTAWLSVGVARAVEGMAQVAVSSPQPFGLDAIRLERLEAADAPGP